MNTINDRDITGALKELSRIKPRPAYMEELRDTIASLPPLSRYPSPIPLIPLRFAYLALAVFILLSGSSVGVVLAARASHPGDTLYGVKRAVERIELVIASSPPARAVLQARIAGNRVEELHDVIDADADGQAVESLVNQYQEEVEQSLEELDRATPSSTTVGNNVASELEKHSEVLEETRANAPPEHQQGIERAIEVSQKGQEAAQEKGKNSEVQGADSNNQRGKNSSNQKVR